MARERGLRVLSSRPAEAERGLAHVGLGDLFDEVLDDVVPALSPPRRRALEIALLRDEAADEPVDHRALAVAVRDVLQLLSERKPTLIAIDDVQWLDPSSSGALAFALRRLAASPVLLLLARRLVDGAEPSALEQALGGERVQRLSVGPLSVGALHRLLRDRFGKSFARQTLLRIHERSGGNPFFALELARALAVDADPTEPFPVPQTLDELVRARIVGLPKRTREALALAAALGTPSTSVLERTGVEAEALDPAFVAHVIEREDGTIRFTHPLLSSVALRRSRRRAARCPRRLAEVVDDPLARARHLALATERPDATVAAVLDDAATNRSRPRRDGARRRARRARAAAVRQRRAPPSSALAAARAHQAAGEWTRARTIATDLLAEAEPGPQRAEAFVLLAEFEVDELAAPLLAEGLHEAATDTTLRLHIEIPLALSRRFTSGSAAALDDVRAMLPALRGPRRRSAPRAGPERRRFPRSRRRRSRRSRLCSARERDCGSSRQPRAAQRVDRPTGQGPRRPR